MELLPKIKKNAKKALSGFWGHAVAIALLLIGCSLMLLIVETLLLKFLGMPPYHDIKGTPLNPFDDIADTSPASFILLGGGWLLSFLIGTPLYYGARRWFYLRSGGAAPDFGDVFYYFSSFKACLGSLWIQLNLVVRHMFWSVVFLLPGVVCTSLGVWAGGAFTDGTDSLLAGGLVASGVIINICAGVFLVVFIQRYSLVRYSYFENCAMPCREHIRLSVRASRGSRVRMVTFALSFWGWVLLCALGLPVLYAMPYFFMSHSILGRLILTKAEISV